jgi:hypothetical protein
LLEESGATNEEQTTAASLRMTVLVDIRKTGKGKQTQIPFGDDNKEQTPTRATAATSIATAMVAL